MPELDIDCLARIVFEVEWESSEAVHREYFLGRKVNMWRDIFPPGMKEELMGKSPGDEVSFAYGPGKIVRGRCEKDILEVKRKNFRVRKFLGRPVYPREGRFYPRGLIGGGACFSGEILPCRIQSLQDVTLTVDFAHPLADTNLNVRARLEDLSPKGGDVGGTSNHWMEEILGTGPGMQARRDGGLPTDFFYPGCFERLDESPDSQFYENPRFVEHIDSQAREFLVQEYSRVLQPGSNILDLMSSVESHLPQNRDFKVTGLGLNSEEMASNPRLDSYLEHDLNQYPHLPFADSSFDALLCSLSVEYLTHPWTVAREIARVLRPGGKVLISASNRWFPPKVVRLWQEMHEFERVGFMLDLLLQTEAFRNLESTSIRNWWRPDDDPHSQQTWISDPVYVVQGIRV